MKVDQLFPSLCDPMDYIVHVILQARILESVSIPFSRASSRPIEPRSLGLLRWQVDSVPLSLQGSPLSFLERTKSWLFRTWIDLEGIMLSEISQTGKEKCCMFSLICGI